MTRLSVKKTYKLYIGGAFPRSESGRTFEAERPQRRPRVAQGRTRRGARRSRGVPRLVGHDRVQPRPGAVPARRDDGGARGRPRAGVHRPRRGRGGDRSHGLVRGLGRQARPGARQLEPGRRAVLRLHGPRADRRRRDPRTRRSRRYSGSCRGCCPRSSAATRSSPSRRASAVAAVELAEALATSDFPGGSVNVLTGFADELAPWLAGTWTTHRLTERGRRPTRGAPDVNRAPRPLRRARARAFLELKTVWHPIGL